MKDTSLIFLWLTENQFQPREYVLDYIRTLKLKSSEIHALYCMWYETNRSLLRGKRENLEYGLADTVKAVSQHLCISGGKEWNDLTPEEKYKQYKSQI